jgi:hypothetical protein
MAAQVREKQHESRSSILHKLWSLMARVLRFRGTVKVSSLSMPVPADVGGSDMEVWLLPEVPSFMEICGSFCADKVA